MAALSEPARQTDIVDLRELRADDLEPLLEEETRTWDETLDWDFHKSADLVRRFVDMSALNGAALMVDDEVAGYMYYVLEEDKGLIGDLYVCRDLRTVEREFAHYLGPMAKVMIRKAAAQTKDVGELYALLSEHISDPEARQRFSDRGRVASGGSGTSPRVIATGETAKIATVPLDKDFVDQTTVRLAGYLGPIAKVVANRAAQKAASKQEFVELVAGHLGSQERGAFLREIGFTET